MPAKYRLNEKQKEEIVNDYESGNYQQTDLAAKYWVSPRTIGRVLREAGVLESLPRVKENEFEMVELLRKYRVNFIGLRMLLRIAHPEVV
jgi:Mor family transcriptional regulator